MGIFLLFFYGINLLVLGIGNSHYAIQANNHVQTQENKYQYKDITTSYGM